MFATSLDAGFADHGVALPSFLMAGAWSADGTQWRTR
jgi:hypothetical protein